MSVAEYEIIAQAYSRTQESMSTDKNFLNPTRLDPCPLIADSVLFLIFTLLIIFPGIIFARMDTIPGDIALMEIIEIFLNHFNENFFIPNRDPAICQIKNDYTVWFKFVFHNTTGNLCYFIPVCQTLSPRQP